MTKILGYGEDALTLWLLKNQPTEILKQFNDKTEPSDCLVFYRPSFGRRGGPSSAQFGEFDAILASKENVYLIESKWDNHRPNTKTELGLRPEQTVRHEVFRWYLSNLNSEKEFIEGKKIAPANSLLSMNLEYVLSQIRQCCPNSAKPDHVKNVLLYFHGPKSSPPQNIPEGFTIVAVEYEGNYVSL